MGWGKGWGWWGWGLGWSGVREDWAMDECIVGRGPNMHTGQRGGAFLC